MGKVLLLRCLPYTGIILLSVCRFSDEQLVQVSTNSHGCFCPGDVLTYECTVVGGSEAGTTLWRGSDFNCPNTDNEIRLRHRIYSSPGGLIQSCNSGAIFRRNLRVENDSYGLKYTSWIDLTLTSDLVGGWIECAHDNGLSETKVGTLNITAELCTLPTNISWILDCSDTSLFVNWNQFFSHCSITQYLITTSSCGSCPTNTSHNNITCTDSPTDGSILCNFTIQAEVHGSVTSPLQMLYLKLKCSEGSSTTTIIISFLCCISLLGMSVGLLAILLFYRTCKNNFKAKRDNKQSKHETHHNYEDIISQGTQSAIADTNFTANIAYGHSSKN